MENKVLRHYKAGYEIREDIFLTDNGETHTMKSAYTPEGEYIGNSKWAYRLCKLRGIKPELAHPDEHSLVSKLGPHVCSIGFCEKENRWYGWSHRAIYGFGIGSTCQKGDCHYVPDNFEEMQKDCWSFKEGKCTVKCSSELRPVTENEICLSVVLVSDSIDRGVAEYKGQNIGKHEGELLPVKGTKIPPQECCIPNCVFELGRGEWTAKTLEEAKLMAIDFAEGVS